MKSRTIRPEREGAEVSNTEISLGNADEWGRSVELFLVLLLSTRRLLLGCEPEARVQELSTTVYVPDIGRDEAGFTANDFHYAHW